MSSAEKNILQARNKIQSFGQAFSKACGVRGKALPLEETKIFMGRGSDSCPIFVFSRREKEARKNNFKYFQFYY